MDYNKNELEEMLLRYIDNDVTNEEKIQLESLLKNHDDLKQVYDNLVIAKDMVRSVGLRNRVHALHKEFHERISTSRVGENKRKAKIIAGRFSDRLSILWRIAAVLILVFVVYGVYKISSVTPAKVYAENYIEYRVPVMRGNEQKDVVDSLYKTGNYQQLVKEVEGKTSATQKDKFFLGLAYLKLDNAIKAIEAFENIEEKNKVGKTNYYNDEAEYYLTLAYIKAGLVYKAERQLNKILSDKNHPYYKKAVELDNIDFAILQVKK